MPTPLIRELHHIKDKLPENPHCRHPVQQKAVILVRDAIGKLILEREELLELEQLRIKAAKYRGDIQQRDETIQELRTALKPNAPMYAIDDTRMYYVWDSNTYCTIKDRTTMINRQKGRWNYAMDGAALRRFILEEGEQE